VSSSLVWASRLQPKCKKPLTLRKARAAVAKVYDTVRQKSSDRSILGMTEKFSAKKDSNDRDPVVSPAIPALTKLYKGNACASVVYVMYDKPGMGKTTAGAALLKGFYSFPSSGKSEGAFLITGDIMQEDFVMKLCGQLEIGDVKGWLHALLLAIDEPVGDFPSILILDAFNSMDTTNLDFIRALYGEMNAMQAKKNIFVVVIKSEEEVAMKLCALNGGLRVRPLPGFSDGKPAKPEWKHQAWSRDLLVEAVRYEYPGHLEDDIDCTFIVDDMSPGEASLLAFAEIRKRTVTVEGPGSPRKKPKRT
jgi:hypothetical protein